MGRPKALLPWGATTLVRAWCRALAPFGPVVVVEGAVSLTAEVSARTLVVNNPDWASTGMWESLTLGRGDRSGPVLVTPVDVPVAPTADLRRLVEASAPAALSWGGVLGHPVLVDAAQLGGSCPIGGLAELLVGATEVQASSSAALANMNTPQDYARFSP